MNMEVRIETKKLVIGNENSQGFRILQKASCIPFLHNFFGYNKEVTRQFVESFNGQKSQIGNLTLCISENFISQVTGLPQIGEKWFKKQHMDEKAWTLYINKSRKAHNQVHGVARSWLKSPWDELAYLIQKYVTCEGCFNLVFLYHIRILQHLNQKKLIDMPYYLLHSLQKMSMQVKKNKNKERSMYHHGLIKMLVEHELCQRGESWNILFWENGFISEIEEDNIQISPSIVYQKEDIPPPRRVMTAMNMTKQVQAEKEKEKEARVPNFQGLQRKSRKSSTSSIGIDQDQNKFHDHLIEKEQRDKHPIFEEIEEIEYHTNQKDFDTTYTEEYFVATHEHEDEDTPEILAAKVHSPILEQVVEDTQKSKRKIKKLKGKLKTFKVLKRFLKNENTLLKERNHTLVSENENLKESQAQLQEEHKLVFHQAFLWNKSRK